MVVEELEISMSVTHIIQKLKGSMLRCQLKKKSWVSYKVGCTWGKTKESRSVQANENVGEVTIWGFGKLGHCAGCFFVRR